MDENNLREKARAAVRGGRLPNRGPERMWGGPGTGANCAICDRPVRREEVGYELQFTRDGESSGPANCHVHVLCFAAWELEPPDSALAPASPSSADLTRSADPPPVIHAASEAHSGTAVDSLALPEGRDGGTMPYRERDYKSGRGPA